MKLDNLYLKVRELLHITDDKLLDVCLATIISREQEFAKLWIILVGRSGNGKSELLKMFEDEKTTKLIRQFTSKTIVNGYSNKKAYPDLAPKLRNKILLIPEMASILTASSEEKANIWAQLRDLYDGIAGKQSGLGADTDYSSLNVSFIGCSTPDIDKQVLVHQSLGTREIIYRCEEEEDNSLMDKIVSNSEIDKDSKRKELKKEIQDFIRNRTYVNFKISKEVEEEIRNLAILTTQLRVSADVDYSTGELSNILYPEAPTRILHQYLTLFRALKSLDEEYSDERALKVLRKITFSCSDPIRMGILNTIIRNHLLCPNGFTKNWLSVEMDVSSKKCFIELNILSSKKVGLLKKEVRIDESLDKKFPVFKLNEGNEIVKYIANLMKIDIQFFRRIK